MAQTIVDRKELGLRLHMLRYSRGLSLLDVQEKSGIPRTTLSRWERARDQSYPDIERLSRVAEIYGITVARLLDSEPLPPDTGYSSDRDTPDKLGRHTQPALPEAA